MGCLKKCGARRRDVHAGGRPSMILTHIGQGIVCMVGWLDREPEIKVGFKREFAKGMQDTLKK